nr:MAG TPA: hypothetical protein [Caudoviricetes sp.]
MEPYYHLLSLDINLLYYFYVIIYSYIVTISYTRDWRSIK